MYTFLGGRDSGTICEDIEYSPVVRLELDMISACAASVCDLAVLNVSEYTSSFRRRQRSRVVAIRHAQNQSWALIDLVGNTKRFDCQFSRLGLLLLRPRPHVLCISELIPVGDTHHFIQGSSQCSREVGTADAHQHVSGGLADALPSVSGDSALDLCQDSLLSGSDDNDDNNYRNYYDDSLDQ